MRVRKHQPSASLTFLHQNKIALLLFAAFLILCAALNAGRNFLFIAVSPADEQGEQSGQLRNISGFQPAPGPRFP